MNKASPVTAATLLRAKQHRKPAVWLTAYDAISAEIAELGGADVLLVGDSLGMVCLGMDSTLRVTLEHMIHHAAAVVRARKRAWVVCDLPFGSYQGSPVQAWQTATVLLQQTGCDAVKLEGGQVMAETIAFLADRGVAVVGHVGLQPQSIKRLGGYGPRGRSRQERQQLLRDAESVAQAGATAIVLENIPEDLAAEITSMVSIPTVGIGAGPHCDAQVLVWHDLLGISERNPPFAPAYADLRKVMLQAIERWSKDVRNGHFPKLEETSLARRP
ncbi:MAG: 3-methyl-2-oxobutanoate hydroxymethyltransferase [Zetaproteobacteria bacterium]|nr:MAG: 3-methyl-2-oxobutanoate hydroxymethyltransferase [Zetaproteobacteria bacterium]